MDEFDIQLQDALARKRAGQQAAENFQMPQGRMVGGRYIGPSISDALIQGLRMYQGQQDVEQAGKQITELTQGRQKAIAEALRNFGQQAQGTPGNAPGDGMGPVLPAQAPDMMGAYQSLLNAPDAGLRQMALQGMAKIPEVQAQREARADEVRMRAEQRAQELQVEHERRMERLAAENASSERMAQQQRDFQREMAKLRSSMGGGSQPYFQPVQTAQGIMAFNARTGKLEPVAGSPIVGAQYDPALQGSLAGAKESGEQSAKASAEAKKSVKRSDVMIDQLAQAESLLKQGPTASGAGAAVDAIGRAVGYSSKGAQTAAQLEALSGWLVSNVPRMEGPQSNMDVQNYQTMAGKIGDRTVPVSERLAALNGVRQLQQKYKSINQESAQQPASKTRIRFDANGNPIQ